MTITVKPGNTQNTHHVRLWRPGGGGEVGLVLCDSKGQDDPRVLRSEPYPRSPIKMYTGEQKYADQELPYRSVVQEDWSRGRAGEYFEDDQDRYADGKRADTTQGSKIILAGRERYSTGVRAGDQIFNTASVEWRKLIGDWRYFGAKFTASATYSVEEVWCWVRVVGRVPMSDLVVRLHQDNAGVPGTIIKSASLSKYAITDVAAFVHIFTIDQAALTNGNVYHVVFHSSLDIDKTDRCWEIGFTAGTGTRGPDGSSWTAVNYAPMYRVMARQMPFIGRFFSYKGALYVATQPDSGTAGVVYLNGYRGVADSNTGNLDRLIDATQSWVTNELAGAVAEIYDGAGCYESTPWRKIISNAATYAVVSPAWNVVHESMGADATLYYIKGTDKWALQHTGSFPFTDVDTTGEVAWLVCGEGKKATRPLRKMRHYAAGDGTWVKDWVSESLVQGSFLQAHLHPTQGYSVWLATNNDADNEVCVTRGLAPKDAKESLIVASAYTSKTTGGFMKEQTITHVTVTPEAGPKARITVGADFTSGLLCSDIPGAVDWRRYQYLQLGIKVSKSLSAGQLRLDLDNNALCGSPYITLDFPALAADRYYSGRDLILGEFDLSEIADAASTLSVGLTLTSDVGAEEFTIDLQFMWLEPEWEIITVGDPADKITGLCLYGDPKQLMVAKQGSLWEINAGIARDLPITALGSVKSSDNGKALLPHDVYLMFSMRQGAIERWFRGNIDDIGPNKDLGFPAGRSGTISDMADFPSGFFAALDGGDTGYSSVLFYNENGWHELYRAPKAGLRIRQIYVEPINGYAYVRVWVSQGGDLLWFPYGLSPQSDTDYRFTVEGEVVSGRITTGKQDVVKFWKSLKLIWKKGSAGDLVTVQYRLDGASAWTTVGNYTEEIEEQNLSPSLNTVGKWLEYRLIIRNSNQATSPEIRAVILEVLEEDEQKDQITFSFRACEADTQIDGKEDPVSGPEKLAKLWEWKRDRLPVYMDCDDKIFHGRIVRPSSLSVRHLKTTPLDRGKDVVICNLNLVEI